MMSRATKLLWINVAILVGSILLWVAATFFGWLTSVAFVSHISIAALVISAISGIAAADAAKESED
jgi:hypothetical protein